MDDLLGQWPVVLDLWRAELEGAAGLASRQDTRLGALCATARSASLFYHQLYRHLPTEGVVLRDLPVVTKRDLMAAFDDSVTASGVTRAGIEAFIADPALIATPFRGEFFVCTSAGTTGHPGFFLHDPSAINVYRAISLARVSRSWFGAGDWLRMAQRGFRWAAVLGTGGHYVGAGWIELERRRDPWRSRAYRLFSIQAPLAELVAGLNAFNPAMLTGYPSALELLADEQSAGRLKLRPLLLECGGETLSQPTASRLAAAFACTVRNMYSASECLPMAFSCNHGWLHINSDWVILEPVEENLDPTPRGQFSHTVLLTNLANRIQPLIRYDLGDSVLMRSDSCECRSPLPAIRVSGRRDDVLRLKAANGRTVKILPLAIGSLVEGTPGVQRSQLVQTGPAVLRVRLALRKGVDGERVWREVIAKLTAYLADQRLGGVKIERASEQPEQPARFGKFRQVIARSSSTGQ